MDTKVCKKCGIEKSLSEFYYRKGNGTYPGKCKKCELSQQKAFHQTKERKEWRNKWNRKYIKKNNIKETRQKAWELLNYAVKNGIMIRPENCTKCGSDKRIQAHHDDYSKPLDVVWLCEQCHKDIHNATK